MMGPSPHWGTAYFQDKTYLLPAQGEDSIFYTDRAGIAHCGNGPSFDQRVTECPRRRAFLRGRLTSDSKLGGRCPRAAGVGALAALSYSLPALCAFGKVSCRKDARIIFFVITNIDSLTFL